MQVGPLPAAPQWLPFRSRHRSFWLRLRRQQGNRASNRQSHI